MDVAEQIQQSDEYIKKTQPFYFYLNKYKWWILGILGFIFFAIIANLIENRKSK